MNTAEMITPAQLDIARRIAALPWFRWCGGMLWCNDSPRRIADPTLWHRHDDRMPSDDGDSVGPSHVSRTAIPLLTDAATEGCIHRQACERLGCDQIHLHPFGWCVPVRSIGAGISNDGAFRIPSDILAAFPDHPHTAAVCAAMLHGANE